jgi:hypothetical protein
MVVGLYAVTRILAARNNNSGTGTTTTTTAASTGTAAAAASVVENTTSTTGAQAKPEDADVERNNGARLLRSRVTNLFTHERSYDESTTTTTTGGREQMKQVLCYDPIIALYLLGLMGWLAWLCFGIAFLSDNDNDNDDDDSRCDNNRNAVFLSLGCGFVYALLVCCTIPCAYACLR